MSGALARPAPADLGRRARRLFWPVAGFELRQQLRSPLFWVTAISLFLLVFGALSSDRIHIGDTGNVHKNSPFAVIQTHLIMALFFLFGAAAFVAGAVVRDDDSGFAPILRAAPLAKSDYLYGRFSGAFAAAALAFLAVPLGVLAGEAAPWLAPDSLGPPPLAPLVLAYAGLALPGLFLLSAVLFAVATARRSMAWTFVVLTVLVVFYTVAAAALDRPEFRPFLARWDPFGLFTFNSVTRYWTAAERNNLAPPLTGVLLFNRVGCLIGGALALAAAYPLFDARERRDSRRRRQRSPAIDHAAAPVLPAAAEPPPASLSRGRVAAAQVFARVGFDLKQVLRGPVFWILTGLGLINAGAAVWQATDDARYGGALYPATRLLIPELRGAFEFFALVLAAFYAGELVWRDRDKRMDAVIDATRAPDWAFVAPKALAVFLALLAAVAASTVAAVLIQLGKGYGRLEPLAYLLGWIAPAAADLAIVAALAIFLQVLAPSKAWGWGATTLYIVGRFAVPGLGFEHNLIFYGSTNPVPLSDMDGEGRYWIGAWWFRAWWAAWAALLLVAANAFWRRGADLRWRARLAEAARRMRGSPTWFAAGCLAAIAASGGWIALNTLALNRYQTQASDDRWLADYEKALLPYEATPEPTLVAVRLAVDIRPRAPRLTARGVYVLENDTGAPLRQALFRFDRPVIVRALSLDGARATRVFPRFNARIFSFDTPLAPGDRRVLSFDTLLRERGFRTSRGKTRDLTDVVANGTFVNSTQFLPVIGMNRDRLLTDRAKRRRYGLPAELHLAPPGDAATRQRSFLGFTGRATTDISVTTEADQTPIAPGAVVSDHTTGGRRTVRFVSATPMLPFFSVQSARYARRSLMHGGVAMAVYYDPRHSANVPRMLRALAASMDYYTANFGPYPFPYVRIVEFPDYDRFAQSFAGTFPWSEGLGFIADTRDPARIDMVTYVAAHELAHQWWGHQLVPANQQGATLLVETLAQYSALRVMRRLEGPARVRKFLKFELDSYLKGRGGEAMAEQPLVSVEDQPYIHYRKGSLVMNRLADEIGEDRVNAALRDLLARFGAKGPPYPTSLDLIAALRAHAPADKQGLITDLFQSITLHDLRATAASARRRPDGRWDVRVTVSAAKLYADPLGKERPAPMDEDVTIGLLTARPDASGFGPAEVIGAERRRLRSGLQTVTFVTDRKPAFVALDPFLDLIQRDADQAAVAVR